jgi:MFS family permease
LSDISKVKRVPDANAPQDQRDPPYPNPRYAWYVLGVLTFVYVFSYLDRQVLNLLVDPVRRDLHISDTKMGLLIGVAFALFYAGFGVPLGRIADSRSRRGLIAVGFALWSLFAIGCGLARNFSQLALMRMGLGVGEASLTPAAWSLITDYFPPRLRGVAQGIYVTGLYFGNGIALVLGGLVTTWSSHLEERRLPLIGVDRSWQIIFLIIGLAGLFFVPLMFSVKEPIRRGAEPGRRSIPVAEVLSYFKTNWKTYCCHNLGIALLAFSSYGSIAWVPSFFIRHHHWTIARTGLTYGVLFAGFGALGALWAGWLSDRLAARGYRDAYIRVALLIAVAWFPTGTLFLLVPNATLAVILLIPTIFVSVGGFSVGSAALMQITPQRMRGQAGAIYLFVITSIGLGLGPTAVALCTDYVFHDDKMVGYSILIVTAAAHVLAALLLWHGRKHFVKTRAAAVGSLTTETA